MSEKANKQPKQQESTPLGHYKQDGKQLKPPLAQLNMQEASWINSRLPEMLWAALLIVKLGRDKALPILRHALKHIETAKVPGTTLTDIAKWPPELRKSFIELIVSLDSEAKAALRPLLIFPKLPAYDDWRAVIGEDAKPEDGIDLAKTVEAVLFHQSQEATDCRWVKVMGFIFTGRVHVTAALADGFEEILKYPDVGDMRSVRPRIRSMEIFESLDGSEYTWAKTFWDACYNNTPCIPELNEETKEVVEQKRAEMTKDKPYYVKASHEVRDSLMSHFFDTSTTTAVDARHETVLGIGLYALDEYIQMVITLTSTSANARVIIRTLFEAYLTLAYLLKKETEGELLWEAYRQHGVGQISLIERYYEDDKLSSGLVDIKMMDRIANEDRWSEFVPINLGHWDSGDLRKIALQVGEKKLYDTYYPYTSGFTHASWGAVRETSMQSCLNPLHRLHHIPSYGLPVLPNANADGAKLIDKILELVGKAYPDFKPRIGILPKQSSQSKKTSTKKKS
jgi:hypothetical protein